MPCLPSFSCRIAHHRPRLKPRRLPQPIKINARRSTTRLSDANRSRRAVTRPSPVNGSINVDRNPSYPGVIKELKRTGDLGRRCRCRPIRYLNNIVEQDHRAMKRRVRASQGFRSFAAAWRTIQGIETVHMIRKGQVKWLAKNDIPGQASFTAGLFGVAATA
ncbi:MAG: DDE-type integrase/transposase/recombinase [Bryobacteraceae bacterium]